MKINQMAIIRVCAFLLILLWVYSSLSKVFRFEVFRQQMAVQALPDILKAPLTYIVPTIELFAAGLLIFDPSKNAGFRLSALLMTVFTVYVGYVVMGLSDHHPCSCGGILGRMGWTAHFLFNVSFLLLTFVAIYLTKRTEKGGSPARHS